MSRHRIDKLLDCDTRKSFLLQILNIIYLFFIRDIKYIHTII